MKKKITQTLCRGCGKPIDKGACDERHTVITRVGVTELGEKYKYRYYLCHSCTLDLDLLIIELNRLKQEEELREAMKKEE